jgi:hypothetical protein
MARTSHCETCTCGLTHVEWSDRGSWVDLTNPQDIANVICACALDHSYDRDDGIPCGFPSEVADALAPVIAKHLSAIEPDWENKTVSMEDVQRRAFMQELTEAARIAVTGQEGQKP